jgi:hypothetical protein
LWTNAIAKPLAVPRYSHWNANVCAVKFWFLGAYRAGLKLLRDSVIVIRIIYTPMDAWSNPATSAIRVVSKVSCSWCFNRMRTIPFLASMPILVGQASLLSIWVAMRIQKSNGR